MPPDKIPSKPRPSTLQANDSYAARARADSQAADDIDLSLPDGPDLPSQHIQRTAQIQSNRVTELRSNEVRKLANEATNGTAQQGHSVSQTLCISVRRAVAVAWQVGGSEKPVWRLVRALKAIDPDMSDEQRSGAFEEWHKGIKSKLSPERSRDDYWLEFLASWPAVKFALGENPVKAAFAAARSCQAPAIAKTFTDPEIRILITACRELQRIHGEHPFYLSCHDAAIELGHSKQKGDGKHIRAYKWLNGFVAAKILSVAVKGTPRQPRKEGQETPPGRSTRYRYLHPLDE